MLILAIDTSSPSGSIAFLRENRVIGTIGSTSTEIYSSRVFRHLDFLLGELSLQLKDFDLFAVAAGPGSFTGLRVGLAAVKGWAEVFGKPIAAVSALEAVAAQARSRTSAAKVVSVMDARRNELYWGFYRRSDSSGESQLALENHEMVGPREEFFREVFNGAPAEELAIVTPAPELLANALSHMENRGQRIVSVESVSPYLAPEIGLLGYDCARHGRLTDSLSLDANYIRRSDAELHWKGSAGS